MKYQPFYTALLAGLLLTFWACTQSSSPADEGHGHSHGEGGHSHDSPDNEQESLSYTLWTKKSELFVEFPPLVVGMKSRFAAHFSKMSDFKPVLEGKVIVRLWQGSEKVLEAGSPKPTSPGIFGPSLSPKQAGTFDLSFILLSSEFNDTIIIPGVEVYPNIEAALAANPHQPERDEISFLKEQAWKVDFAIEQAKLETIHEVIHTSGEIQPVQGAETVVTAKTSGIVFFKSSKIQTGNEVRHGEELFSINSSGLLQSNLEEKRTVAQARLEKTKAEFDRAAELLENQAISLKEYERREMEFTIASAELQTFTDNYSKGGQNLSAPMSGIIKDVLISNGQFVEEGTPLLQVTQNRRLTLKGEVSQKYLPQLQALQSANFKTPYQETIQSIEDYNGRIISRGNLIEAGSNFIPVVFELDNLGGLIPGSFVELFLLTKPTEPTLVLPNSAIMENYGAFFVYVQTGGESFEKREIKLGVNDGVKVQILSGITEGEWVVTKGAYQVRMASMSSSIPAHGHTH